MNTVQLQFQQVFLNALQELGIPLRETYDIEEVNSVMQNLDYKSSVELIHGWIQHGIVAPIPDDKWTFESAFMLMAGLELRQLWCTSPSRHDCKKSRVRLSKEAMRATDVEKVLDMTSAYDDLFCIRMLAQAEQQHEKDQLVELLASRIDPVTCRFRPHPEHQGV
jgi:hypothetical protein